ncbi:MAG: hypothetical protein SGI73_04885 [Chloroflexota bacterium]|nr:hypothetical protein [Chloroflexota bacterium]
MTTIPTSADARTSGRAERRTLTRIFLIALLGLIGTAVVAGLLPRGAQANLIANFLLTLLILCPAAVCLLPLYLGLMIVVFNVQRAHRITANALAKVNTVSANTMHSTQRAAEGWAKRSIQFNLFFAPLDKALFSLFDRPARSTPSDQPQTKGESPHDPTQQR